MAQSEPSSERPVTLVEELQERVAALEAANDRLTAEVQRGSRENEDLREENTELRHEVNHLKATLRKYENPHTPSSRRGGAGGPPPTGENDEDGDEADGDAGGDAEPSGTRGRKEGHPGTTRPAPEPDETRRVSVDHECCPECGEPLDDARHWVEGRTIVDIPEPPPITVTKFLLEHRACSCGCVVAAGHPDCPPEGREGPHLLALITLLKYVGRLPHDKVVTVLEELYGWELSTGTSFNSTARVADLLRPAYEEVQAELRTADVVYADETGFRVGGQNEWLWGFNTDTETLYAIRPSRGSQVLEEVLGEDFPEEAVLSVDGWSAYPAFHQLLQRCWAHLLRECEDIADESATGAALSDRVHALYRELTAFVATDPSQEERDRKRQEAFAELRELAETEYESEAVAKLATKLRNGLGFWLTFVTEPGVESTNNRAERALREQVVLRKIIGSLNNRKGARIHETIATMLATWAKRDTNPVDELLSVIREQGAADKIKSA